MIEATVALAQQAHEAVIPDDVAELAAQAILDTLACGIAGAHQPNARAAREAFSSPGDVDVWGTGRRVDPTSAALINGIAAHELDYDDWAPGSGAHASVAIVPALLAAAASAPTSGRRLLTAYAVGYELQERVGRSIGPAHYTRGFHTTGLVGPLGAATAAGLVMGVDVERLVAALGFAATSAGGLTSVFGSAGKHLNAGNAAAAGLRAARFAAAGAAAASGDILSGARGLADIHTESIDVETLALPFGRPWLIRSNLIKFSPACFGTHGAIAAAAALRGAGIDPDQVASVRIVVPPITRTICAIPDPRTGLEGKFSLAYATAEAFAGPVTTTSFAEPFTPSPRSRRLTAATQLVYDATFAKTQAAVIVRLDDGSTTRVDADAGTPAWTHDPREQRQALHAKAHDLCDPVIGESLTDELICAVYSLADGASSADLRARLGALSLSGPAAAGGR